jgi:F0F1-type ATP synthase assembly protein I
MQDKPTPREMGYYMALAQTGFEMVLPAVGGSYLDRWLDTSPWITIVLGALGFAAGLIHLVLLLKQKDKDESSDQTPPS